MIRLLVASLLAYCAAAAAQPTVTEGPMTVTLLQSSCSSEATVAWLTKLEGRTESSRADVMLYGVFVSACWSGDADGDIIVVDRDGSGVTIYRKAFDRGGTDT